MNEQEYQSRIAVVDEWAKSLSHELAGLIEANPDEVIYHYTGADGLIGMLESGRIWATHVSRMNDSVEYEIGVELVERWVRDSLDRQSRPLIEKAIANLESVDTYIACYSAAADRLSQWRAYAGSGVGYCVGFDTSKMATTDGRMPLLEKVIYSEAIGKAVVVRLLDRVEEFFCGNDFGEVEVGYLLGMLESLLNTVACVIKHSGFEEETEYRQIYQPLTSSLKLKNKFRSGLYGLTPYVEVSFLEAGRLPIESITIGPCKDQHIEAYTLRMLLSQYGYENVEIRKSGVPLRV